MSLKRLFPLLFLAIFLVIVYFLQVNISETKSIDSRLTIINFSYLFNFGFTVISFLVIVVFYKLFKKQIGFIFLILSTMKILVFVVGSKFADFSLGKTDFLHFFIPFFICLFFEVFYLSRMLNRSDFSEDA